MKYTNIFGKILLIFDLVQNSLIYIIFTILAFITLVLCIKKVISKKACFISNFITTSLLIVYTIYNNFDTLSKTFDNIMNNIFTIIYFPSAYAYLSILLTINIICIISLLKINLNKTYKTINGICLIITNFIFVLILEIISKNEIDIFTKSSLFSNPSLVMLLEFSINIFITWIISLLIINLTNIIIERKHIKSTNKELVTTPALTIENNNLNTLEEEYLYTKNKFIPNDLLEKVDNYDNSYKFIPVLNENKDYSNIENTFDLSSFIPIQPTSIKEETNKNEVQNIISLIESVNNKVSESTNMIEEHKTINVDNHLSQRNSYTLNDYRIFNKMLKDIKEHNEGNIINIDKNLEYRLITKYSSKDYDMFKQMLKIYLS